MNDKQINTLILAQLAPLMAATSGLSGVALARNFQATQQGANSGPTVYFSKLFDKRYGHVARREQWDADLGTFRHFERQQYETHYQFSAWVPQTPVSTTTLTESDILNIVSGIMQSDAILTAFRAAGAGIQRVTDVRNPYVVDDHDRFEAVPSFDIVLTHQRERETVTPAVVSYDARIVRV